MSQMTQYQLLVNAIEQLAVSFYRNKKKRRNRELLVSLCVWQSSSVTLVTWMFSWHVFEHFHTKMEMMQTLEHTHTHTPKWIGAPSLYLASERVKQIIHVIILRELKTCHRYLMHLKVTCHFCWHCCVLLFTHTRIAYHRLQFAGETHAARKRHIWTN